MTRTLSRTTAAATTLALAAALASCAPAEGDDGTVEVLASFYPLEYVADEIGGEHVTVSSLTPPAAEPHDLELSPSAVRSVGEADLVVYLSGFQAATDEAIDAQSPEHVVDTAEAAGLEGGTDALDPHFWLDPTRLATVGHQVADELSAVDPDNAADYAERADDLEARLTDLDTRYAEQLTSCQGATLVTSHEAFGYLADRYGLVQVGITGIDPEVDPSPKRLREVRQIVEDAGVTTLFFEILVSPKVTQTLADDLGVATAVLDPIEGHVDVERDYLEIMGDNLDALTTGLNCS
ncbi:metal ABC transporter substrate-binding protein [Sanguibacter suaedae]|uniref:Zinc ABC transporter substrate-binding protein n=1 Tax=Sanguibacter suaedae TaxID=2795737 RepID=A0A934I3M7_9MICO|nr:metal ABC transporter substrate-binding protein [Sanguibacter suaedae]MBI9113626.1 zinc ABC transporter substrate-binding protein [Sanguibacter suaedae]